MDKLKSRKFWICVAAALGSLGTGISGLIQGNETLALAGGILLVISSSIYAFCEAWVDGRAAHNDETMARLLTAIHNVHTMSEEKES